MQFNKEAQLVNVNKDIEELKQKRRLVSEALVGFQTLTDKESELTQEINFLRNLSFTLENAIKTEKELKEWRDSLSAV